MPQLRLIPVGGVELPDVVTYLRAGATAVGVGSPLIGDALDGGVFHALFERAAAYVDAARPMRARRIRVGGVGEVGETAGPTVVVESRS